MDRKTLDALSQAISLQYKARAIYRAAIERFGLTEPFVHLADVSAQDVATLRRIHERDGIEPPSDGWLGRVEVSYDFEQVCREAIRAESEAAEACERLTGELDDPAVRLVLSRLEEACRYQRRPLLQRALDGHQQI